MLHPFKYQNSKILCHKPQMIKLKSVLLLGGLFNLLPVFLFYVNCCINFMLFTHKSSIKVGNEETIDYLT